MLDVIERLSGRAREYIRDQLPASTPVDPERLRHALFEARVRSLADATALAKRLPVGGRCRPAPPADVLTVVVARERALRDGAGSACRVPVPVCVDLRILAEGELGAGDEVDISERPSHGVTIGLVARAITLDETLLARAAAAPELPDSLSRWMLERAA